MHVSRAQTQGAQMACTQDIRLLISCTLLGFGPAATAAPALRLEVPPPDVGANLPATPEPVYSGRLSLTSSLPTLAPAQSISQRRTTGETATLRHSPLAGSLITAPIAGS
ncbi:MAG: hypothetical protein WCC36_02285, partial [Gammaproteobacteria bacterium]